MRQRIESLEMRLDAIDKKLEKLDKLDFLVQWLS